MGNVPGDLVCLFPNASGHEYWISKDLKVERLIPLVQFLMLLSALPNVTLWVLRTIEGYRTQFSSRTLRFNGVLILQVDSL